MRYGKGKKIFSAKNILWMIFLIQVILIAVSNLTLIEKNLDCDIGKLFRHIMAMWDHKTLRIPGWMYSTTVEYDCTTLFALPIYGLTKNVFLACGMSNIILFGMFTAAVFYVLDGKDKIYPLLAMNLIAVPYSVGMLDYYNMMFFGGSQYVIKVMLPLLLIGVLLHLERYEEMEKKQRMLFFGVGGVYLFLLLLTSVSSGIYVTVCGLLPVLAVYVGRKFFLWERVNKREIALIAGTVVCALFGVYGNMRIMGGARGQGMVFNSVYQALGNFFSCFIGFFELFGGATKRLDLAIFTPEGIGIMLKLFVALCFLLCGAFQVSVCLRKKSDLSSLLLISVPIWNYFILNVVNARAGSETYEYRYHLIGAIPLILLAVTILLDGLQMLRESQSRCLMVCVLTALMLLCTMSYRDLFSRGEQNAELKEFCAYCSQNLDVEVVYLYKGSNDSDICRALDQSVPYICLLEGGHTWTYDYYASYVDAPMQTENVVIAVDNELEDWGDRYEVIGRSVVRFAVVGGKSLYCFE